MSTTLTVDTTHFPETPESLTPTAEKQPSGPDLRSTLSPTRSQPNFHERSHISLFSLADREAQLTSPTGSVTSLTTLETHIAAGLKHGTSELTLTAPGRPKTRRPSIFIPSSIVMGNDEAESARARRSLTPPSKEAMEAIEKAWERFFPTTPTGSSGEDKSSPSPHEVDDEFIAHIRSLPGQHRNPMSPHTQSLPSFEPPKERSGLLHSKSSLI